MNIEHQFKIVCRIVEATMSDDPFDEITEMRAKLIALDRFLDNFFWVAIGLEEKGWGAILNGVGEEASIMWHAIYCEMRAKETFDLGALDKDAIFKRFIENIEANKED